ncbi:Uncharacterised protein [Serratia fonticola]|nr:Uncharacterised protein [Serratia fonticola]CAI1199125.1 Uncharacterised protein [Serratia fonticola]
MLLKCVSINASYINLEMRMAYAIRNITEWGP